MSLGWASRPPDALRLGALRLPALGCRIEHVALEPHARIAGCNRVHLGPRRENDSNHLTLYCAFHENLNQILDHPHSRDMCGFYFPHHPGNRPGSPRIARPGAFTGLFTGEGHEGNLQRCNHPTKQTVWRLVV